MGEWLSGLAGGSSISALVWILVALALLVAVLFVLRFLRRERTETFDASGHHRPPRLDMVDAIAIDSQRRLVLVKRDDVEHLILIGGPSDIVVEEAIMPHKGPRAAPQQMRPVRTAAKQQPRHEPEITNGPANGESASPTPQAPATAADATARRNVKPAPAGNFDAWLGKDAKRAGAAKGGEPGHGGVDVMEEKTTRAPKKDTQQPKRTESSIEDDLARLLDDLTDDER